MDNWIAMAGKILVVSQILIRDGEKKWTIYISRK
jgi:hypothetical protein